MNKAVAHRGPDGDGMFCSSGGYTFLGNRRLSIVDVKNGKLPCTLKREGYEYSLVFNGEIFNYKKIRQELIGKGYKFTTNSDSEVLLKSYIQWGSKCMQKFNGEFAFAIFDGKKQTIFLARDPVGVKPLFYTVLDDKTFVFSSEPKGILQHPAVKREPDNEMIADFFLGMMTFADFSENIDRSFFKNIFSIKPGNFVVFDKNGLTEKLYYKIQIHKNKDTEKSYAPLFRKTLDEAIKIRIPDEVSFGTALSGGVDSSIVTATIAKTGSDFIATSAKFQGNDENIDFQYAKLLSKKYKLKLIPTVITPKSLVTQIDPMIKAMDAPHDAMRQLSLFLIYKLLKKHKRKVVLVGEGADEFNLGYYHQMAGYEMDEHTIINAVDFQKALLARSKKVSKFFTKEFLSQISFSNIIENNYLSYYEASGSKDPIEKMQFLHIKRFLKYRLDANDRCGMAHSIEARVPFCDKNVINVSLSIPKNKNITKDGEKNIEKQAYRDLVPREILQRKKYPLPESKNFEFYELINKELENNILSTDSRVWKILNKKYVISINKKLFDKINALKKSGKSGVALTSEIPISKPAELRMKHIFAILTLIRWYNIYFCNSE